MGNFLLCLGTVVLAVAIVAGALMWAAVLVKGGAGPEAIGIALAGIAAGLVLVDYAERRW